MASTASVNRRRRICPGRPSWPPILAADRKAGKEKSPRAAKGSLQRLIAYRLLEGTWNVARLTAKGRAALKLHSARIDGYQPPDAFESHAPDVFDDHGLRPVYRVNIRLDFMDQIMKRVPKEYRNLKLGDELPDNELTWRIMLAEYKEEDYRASGTLNGCSALLTVNTGLRPLNGSLRTHHSYPVLSIHDEQHREICEIAMSFEGLAELLVGNHEVPVTLDSHFGIDGMRRALPVPDPVSIRRRVHERVKRHRQDSLGWLAEVADIVKGGRMGKKLQAAILEKLDLAMRDVAGEGSFAAQQAMEEVSSVAESFLTIMVERTGADRPLLSDGTEVSSTLLIEGQVTEDEAIDVQADEGLVELDEGEVTPELKMVDGTMLRLVEQADKTEHWVRADIIHEVEIMLATTEDNVSDAVKSAAAFLKASAKLPWNVALDITQELNDEMLYGDME